MHGGLLNDDYFSRQQFKQKNHSLYLSASQVAAMVRLNPYTNLQKLFMGLVYQGQIGKLLLHHDAKLLQISLMGEEESLRQIALKGGVKVKKAFEESMKIAKGKRHVNSTEVANEIKKDIVKKVTDSGKRLSKGEVKLLLDGVRYNVNTGYGKAHEENALDIYEKQCGWEVRERNAERKCWKFMRMEDSTTYDQAYQNKKNIKKTVVPMEKVDQVGWNHPNTRNHNDGEKGNNINRQEQSNKENVKSGNEVGCSSTKAIEIHSSQEDNDGTKNSIPQSDSFIDQMEKRRRSNKVMKPFFSINGMIDGVRDELYHVPSVTSIQDGSGITNYDLKPEHMDLNYSDDDEWSIRQVVVECKHRMNKAFNPPPIYEQIQCLIYAFMYETSSEAEIVQVVRNGTQNDGGDNLDTTLQNKQVLVEVNEKQLGGTATECVKKLHEDNSTNKSKQNASSTSPSPTTSVKITSHRVSLDEPVMRHRQNWNDTVLPRLRSFVDAIYSIRSNDDKRYRLLRATALASSGGGGEYDWWQIIHDECPWLLDCNTGFSRIGKTFN